MTLNDALTATVSELNSATKTFSKFHSTHEGYAVILEELDELWDKIKNKNSSADEITKEAIQVAAMGLRFLVDCCGEQ